VVQGEDLGAGVRGDVLQDRRGVLAAVDEVEGEGDPLDVRQQALGRRPVTEVPDGERVEQSRAGDIPPVRCKPPFQSRSLGQI
jgi:hypothetical protein